MFAKLFGAALAVTASTCGGGSDSDPSTSGGSEVHVELGVNPYSELDAAHGHGDWERTESAFDGNGWAAQWDFFSPSVGEFVHLRLVFSETVAQEVGFAGFGPGTNVLDLETSPDLLQVEVLVQMGDDSSMIGVDVWNSRDEGILEIEGCPGDESFQITMSGVEMRETSGTVDGEGYDGWLDTSMDADAYLVNPTISDEREAFQARYCRGANAPEHTPR